MPDYDRWKGMNSSAFNVYDYIHCVFREGKVAPDLAYAFFYLFWPQFIEIDGDVFLKEKYDEKRIFGLKKKGYTGQDLEYWINLTSLESLLPESQSIMARHLTDELAVVWRIKLQNDFPQKTFHVRCLDDDGERYVVFSQETVKP